ncbi:MAG: FkbM family methyltransferase [Alphaproteobacteria bacterium]|nr:FkbM family methyltransferase [Alphaproteobacteria bacterium]
MTGAMRRRATVLDRIAEEHGSDGLAFLKCDAEGAEPEVLEGRRELLRRTARIAIGPERQGGGPVKPARFFSGTPASPSAHANAAGSSHTVHAPPEACPVERRSLLRRLFFPKQNRHHGRSVEDDQTGSPRSS